MEADRPAGLTLIRQTMAPVYLLRLPRWLYRANICTNGPTTARCTAPWPSWAKRKVQFGVAEDIMLAGGVSLSKPEKRARGLPVHGADRGHHGDQYGMCRTLRFAASCTHHHHRWLLLRLNHSHFADSQVLLPRSLHLKPLGWE